MATPMRMAQAAMTSPISVLPPDNSPAMAAPGEPEPLAKAAPDATRVDAPAVTLPAVDEAKRRAALTTFFITLSISVDPYTRRAEYETRFNPYRPHRNDGKRDNGSIGQIQGRKNWLVVRHPHRNRTRAVLLHICGSTTNNVERLRRGHELRRLALGRLASLRVDERHAAGEFDAETAGNKVGNQIPLFDSTNGVTLIETIAFDFDLNAHLFGFESGALAINRLLHSLGRGDSAGLDSAGDRDFGCVRHGFVLFV
ncbi:hypothetical protein XFF7767_900018 [Xanthomonas citri pv. fuscans]|nr:hypothetical protein XFF7767_900018 [Xanthomonas citri pv. fuscans]SOO16966.1 hypothetical protein XFF7766_970028 [Xanthomonas citri pv. fuscans]